MASKKVSSLSQEDILVMKTGLLLERLSLKEYIPAEPSYPPASVERLLQVEVKPNVVGEKRSLDSAFGFSAGLLSPIQLPHAPDWASINLLQKLRDEPHAFLGVNTIILVDMGKERHLQLNKALPLDVLVCVFGTSHEKAMKQSHLVHGNRLFFSKSPGSVSFAMTFAVGAINALVPKHVAFVIMSEDARNTFQHAMGQLRHTSRGRSYVVNPPSRQGTSWDLHDLAEQVRRSAYS